MNKVDQSRQSDSLWLSSRSEEYSPATRHLRFLFLILIVGNFLVHPFNSVAQAQTQKSAPNPASIQTSASEKSNSAATIQSSASPGAARAEIAKGKLSVSTKSNASLKSNKTANSKKSKSADTGKTVLATPAERLMRMPLKDAEFGLSDRRWPR
jgi:hypothetical protein